jgi:N-acetylmuramoyl-L-alanine amidase
MKEHLVAQYNQRKTAIDMLVLHSYASADIFESCARNDISTHYTIDADGGVTLLVREENRAWHAGKGFWRGIGEDLNSRSVGIEIWNRTLGQSPFPEKQTSRVISLCRDIIRRHGIPPENIVGHSDIAPERKPDPGLSFPWRLLAENGIGLWYDLRNADKFPSTDIAELLGIIGYGTGNIQASAYAFCRRFLPEYVKPDPDIGHLVDHVLTDDFSFMAQENFLKTLQAVAFEYRRRGHP